MDLKQKLALCERFERRLDLHEIKFLLHALDIDLGNVDHLQPSKAVFELVERTDRKGKLAELQQLFGELCEEGQVQSAESLQQIDLYHLPQPTTPLIGRTAELQQLDAALADATIHSIALIAAGGVGKSAITHEWLRRQLSGFEADGTRVFAWSFYSQGAHETQTSSLRFFEEAWRFFGGSGDVPTTDEQRGRGLAALLRQQRCVLVLDGLEPLQHRIDIQRGELKDQALRALLREVWAQGLEGSLVVISSRQPIVELASCVGYRAINLERLSVEDGVQLLRRLGVEKGLPADFAAAAQHGHALSLVLLGHLLRRYFAGDVRCREQLPLLFEEREQGEHARRVIAAHAERLTEAQRVFMRMLGLFDRPMAEGEKDVLLAQWESAKALAALSSLQWADLLSDLRTMGLLLESDDGYDTHPLIRSFFEETDPAAHRILFEYFQQIPEEQQPDTLEELEPLYRAVHHGCLAGEYLPALDVYDDRIRRGDAAYSAKQLGAFTADLAAVADFFPQGWVQPVQTGLSEADQGWLLGQAAFYLMSLGRLREAVEPNRPSIPIREKLEDWRNAAQAANNLVDLLLPLGELLEAEAAAQQAIAFAERSGDQFTQMVSHSKLATTQHRQGKLAASLSAFQQAEAIQAEINSTYPRLFAIWGATYSLLSQDFGKIDEVLERTKYSQDIDHTHPQYYDLLSTAYDHFTLALAQTQPTDRQHAFAQAVAGIRQSGWVMYTPHFLLHRAQFHHDQHNPTDAWHDLTEAEDIIQNCDMALYAVDAHLLRGHLLLTSNPPNNDIGPTDPIACIHAAEQGIQKTGYHLRDAELHLLKAAAYPDQKHHYLDLAQQRIDEIGQFGLLPRLEKMKNM